MKRPIRVANFSGALGDRTTALSEVVNGEPVDVAIGDYMAEITMANVATQFIGNNEKLDGFSADIFLEQLKPELSLIAKKGIKIVVNAGVFNPRGLVEAVRQEIQNQNLSLTAALVEGENLLNRVDELRAEGQLKHMEKLVPLN
ncbi:acyclic terpene utilization AtuA family protein [Scopulibacillus cellulosilyticus]|uniref:Acyclic terpene utilization AtuA family protein n=1 Tax=Scopulibacillus cellulosilyticus TaxID=2665665 RepID=A0ABW2PU21_9BACL